MINSVWITYAWDDNKDGDVDYTAQELIRAGLDVKLDRWNLSAGKRLWEQIETFIQDSSKSNGWLLYATQASLGSEKCKEELAIALDRALEERGNNFPIIALFPGSVDNELIPASIKIRLFVSTTDPDWKERIVAAVQGRQATITRPQIEPYALTVHQDGEQYVIEVRPRAGTWSPFLAGIPIDEKEAVSPRLSHGSVKRIPRSTILMSTGEGTSNDGKLWITFAGNEATPTQSYYIFCKKLPSLLIFGINGGPPQYQVTF